MLEEERAGWERVESTSDRGEPPQQSVEMHHRTWGGGACKPLKMNNLNRLLGAHPNDSLMREADPVPRTQHCPMGGRRARGTRHEGVAKAGQGRASGSQMAEETARMPGALGT